MYFVYNLWPRTIFTSFPSNYRVYNIGDKERNYEKYVTRSGKMSRTSQI